MSESKNNLGKLFQRVASVTAKIGALAADARHDQQRYDYLSSDKVLYECGKAMSEEGLTIIPMCLDQTVEIVQKDERSKPLFQASLPLAMVLADTDGNTYTADWQSSGVDYSSPDKAVFKAMTSGHKYFMMKLFNISVGNEDGEHQSEPKEEQTPLEWLKGLQKITYGSVARAIVDTAAKTSGTKMSIQMVMQRLKSHPELTEYSDKIKNVTAIKDRQKAIEWYEWLEYELREEIDQVSDMWLPDNDKPHRFS